MSNKKADFMANLIRAKQTMDAVESGEFKVDHSKVNSMLESSGSGQLLESLPDGAIPNRTIDRPMNAPNESQIDNSRLPDAVKKLMKEQPIPKMEMGSGGGPTFTIDDVRGMVQKSPSVPQQQTQAQPTNTYYTQTPQPTQITETVVTNSQGKMLVTLTEEELDKKINDALMKFMTEHFTKNLKEETIKRTISTLIKEGKLKVRTKTTK